MFVGERIKIMNFTLDLLCSMPGEDSNIFGRICRLKITELINMNETYYWGEKD